MKTKLLTIISLLFLLFFGLSKVSPISAAAKTNQTVKPKVQQKSTVKKKVVTKKVVKKTPPKKTAVKSVSKKPVVKKVAPKKAPAPKKVVKTPKKVVKPAVQKISKEQEEEIKKKICDTFGDKCKEALIIAKHESGFNPTRVSKTKDHGVFQLNCRWQGRRVGGDCSKFHDIDTNIKIAKQIYDEQGWRPWSTRGFIKKEMAL